MISVCIATYNGEKYIKEQLNSILSQLSSEDEIIISDDMSTDSTLSIIESLNDERIKIYIHDENHCYTKNFENALKLAKGDYIFLSDQDDIWKEDKVKITMEYLKKYDFVISDCLTFKDSKVISKSRFDDFGIKKGFWKNTIRCRYLGCCMAFTKDVKNLALPFPKRTDIIEHDYWLAAIGEYHFKTSLIKEPLVYYRRHSSNTSDGGFSKGYSFYDKIYRRFYRIYETIKRKK